MEYLVGIVLALAVGILASFFGLDRDRAFYPTVMIVIATYYALFAIMGKSIQALGVESIVIAGFLLASLADFKRTLWWIATLTLTPQTEKMVTSCIGQQDVTGLGSVWIDKSTPTTGICQSPRSISCCNMSLTNTKMVTSSKTMAQSLPATSPAQNS